MSKKNQANENETDGVGAWEELLNEPGVAVHGLRFVCAGPPLTPAVFCEKPFPPSLVELCNFVGDELSGVENEGCQNERERCKEQNQSDRPH